MDASYITAFINSIENVFSTMLQMPVTVEPPSLKDTSQPAHDVSAIIGLSGDVEGSVVLCFPTSTAESCISLFIGEEVTSEHADFADAVGELCNMIAGGAKGQFEGKSVSISVPSVVIGQGHSVRQKKDLPVIEIPCSCDSGPFSVDVTLVEQADEATTTEAATA